MALESSNMVRRRTLGVVIPAHNAGPFIERSLESVYSQTSAPDEVVVVDDNSTDDTAERIRRFAPEAKLIQISAGGCAAARNVGVESSTTDFVAFLDADDYWDADHLLRMRRAIDATNGRAWLYFANIRYSPERGGSTLWDRCGLEIEGAHEIRDGDKQWLFAAIHPMMIQASTVDRNAFLSVGGCDTRLKRRSDTHLIFKLGLGGPLCAVAGTAGECTADNPRSLTQSFRPDHRVYDECTAALYADLLKGSARLDQAQERIFCARAARAHMALARRAGLRRPKPFFAHLAAACRFDPRTPVEAAIRSVSRTAAIPRRSDVGGRTAPS